MRNFIFFLAVLTITACSKTNSNKMTVTINGNLLNLNEFQIFKSGQSSNSFNIDLSKGGEHLYTISYNPNGYSQGSFTGITGNLHNWKSKSQETLSGVVTIDNGKEATGTLISSNNSSVVFDHYDILN